MAVPPSTEDLAILAEALKTLQEGFEPLPVFASEPDRDRMREILLDLARRLRDNYPYHHPLYAGQMLKPPHPIARLAYGLTQWLNPNNHALDGGRASSAMEKEVVAEIAGMFGWPTHLGHLCGGGTMANLEALWVSGRFHPGKTILASSQAHYTHARISEVLQLHLEAIPCDALGRMDVKMLAARLDRGDVGTVVATAGTTATGSVDPLPGILDLQKKYNFRIHVDAAYGGYFVLIDNLEPETRKSFELLGSVDSIAIDPHKHGLQPYGCGCILFKEPSVGRLYKHDSPYTYFSSNELHLGEISLECSRAGASAAALWATQRLLPLKKGGEFAAALAQSRLAAQTFYRRVEADGRFLPVFPPELDIVVWAPRAESASRISDLSRKIFEGAATRDLHLAMARMPAALLCENWPPIAWDQDYATCLRSCLMKPEHLSWIDPIWKVLDEVALDALAT